MKDFISPNSQFTIQLNSQYIEKASLGSASIWHYLLYEGKTLLKIDGEARNEMMHWPYLSAILNDDEALLQLLSAATESNYFRLTKNYEIALKFVKDNNVEQFNKILLILDTSHYQKDIFYRLTEKVIIEGEKQFGRDKVVLNQDYLNPKNSL